MKTMDALSTRAVAAATTVARKLGLRCNDEPELLADGSNVLVHLRPSPVVARVATTTGLVRKPAQDWLALDLDLAGFLAGRNFPVVAPSTEVPSGPHISDDLALTFWEYVEHDRGYVSNALETGAFLRELHAELRGFRGNLRHLSPFTEIPQWLDEVEEWGAVAAADLAMLRRGYAAILVRIDALALPEQALHGDAHKKNVLKTSRGLVWTDFEDACRGPIAWDVACFVRTSGEERKNALASYDVVIEPEHLEPFFEARDLQGAVWGAILSTRFADRRARAEEWMAVCRERYASTSD
ncbi:phosphotransferase [Alloacidobacterium dinghuense]|uniref:Phosphotransferase n=1 Tax=Alloacidobacterium dinghuense TaxID=2763107 RepID=A0A7G8BHZ2_9BACT|nr:phosphotransferase [Alloacidobacterium dinghuense]QNI32162.1 phosphotransferase [Alloacidobacterium dinghuense]